MRKLRVMEMIDRPFLGGGQVHLLAVARGLDRETFDVTVAAGTGGPLQEEARRSGLAFAPVSMGKMPRPSTAKRIASVLCERRVDILHTHGGIAGLFGRWAARLAGTPVVVHTLHGIHYLHYRNPILRRIYVMQERYFALRTDAVVFVSKADAAQGRRFKLVPAGRMRVIRNGILPPPAEDAAARGARLAALRGSLGISPPVVGAVSRLHRQKGIADLLEAAPEILRRHGNAWIVVAGGGALEPELRRRAAQEGFGGRFLLLGERPDAADLMALFDVFVLPSLWEGLPLALLEAAARGLPIVATDIDGVREVVRDGETALLVPAGDPGSLAAAVVDLLTHPERAARLGAAAKAEIPPRFTERDMIAGLQDLYVELAGRKIPPGPAE